jgi:hypothetical protein
MSLQTAAQHLAAQGRGPDTTLVHMAPGEVKSLQAIAMAHGGSLTINPQTGLPEAGFLSRLLPVIAGAALTATGVGAPMAALLVGGGTGLATGNLSKGLMAGLGAFGGAGLGSALAGAGAAQIGQTAVTDAVGQATAQGLQGEAYNQAIQNSVAEKMAGLSHMDKLQAGFSNLGSGAFTNAMGGTSGMLKTGLSAAGPLLMGEEKAAAAPGVKATTPYPAQQFNPGMVTPTPQADVPAYADMGQNFSSERRYFNPSFSPVGVAAPTTQMPFMAAVGGPVEDMSMRNDAQMMMTNGPQMYAAGGMSHLGDYSDGGRLLRGPGDGVSDSIPATIANKRPARLADGEFVVPARIVSELGNGSTEAGARKLYAMMDRVQRARGQTVGKGRVAKNSRADKYLPA